jgi:hypothetical protein
MTLSVIPCGTVILVRGFAPLLGSSLYVYCTLYSVQLPDKDYPVVSDCYGPVVSARLWFPPAV